MTFIDIPDIDYFYKSMFRHGGQHAPEYPPNTILDGRNDNSERPNRCVPYQLPHDIEEKLTQLMGLADCNSGSIDLIYTPDKEYYFLEINPVGKFQWLERNCNYYISRDIANILITK